MTGVTSQRVISQVELSVFESYRNRKLTYIADDLSTLNSDLVAVLIKNKLNRIHPSGTRVRVGQGWAL